MILSKIDLSSLKAIAHSDDGLALIVDRGDELECISIPAPFAAYAGLRQLDELIAAPPELSCDDEIELLPVCSSMAASVGYDFDREVLQIEFNNGTVYQYSDIEPETWIELQSTDSIGEFYNHEIKGNYPSEKIR